MNHTVTLNGTEIYFEIHGNGDPLLLLHGFSGSSADWARTIDAWHTRYQLIVPDLRGHGRSEILSRPFRHQDAAHDMLALLDHLRLDSCSALGVSGGGNVLLHIATMRPDSLQAMVLVSATPYFPAQARPIMRDYRRHLSAEHWEILRRSHPGGDPQIEALLRSTESFADSYDDLSFTPPLLATIRARTLIVQGDRDPFYPLELSVEMARAIPQSSLWIVPNAGHGPVFGERWSGFLDTAASFLGQTVS